MKGSFARRFLCVFAAGTCLQFGAGTAWAADDAAGASSGETAAPAPDTGSIIVTARRRSETLQSTPIAITAVSPAMLESKAATTIGDLQGAAPGLLITQQNSGAQAANLSIRGLTYADVEKSQTPTVGVVVDGVTIGTSTGQLQDVFDIAQIEVLRGPQGTLFGANTIGGVINIQRTLPTMQTGGKAEFTYGQWNTWSGKALLNLGNGSSFGVKTWYFHNQTDGYYWNTTTNSRTGGSKSDNFGASLLFKPAGTGFDAQFTIEDVIQSFVPVNVSITKPGEAFYGVATVPDSLYDVSDAPTFSHYHAPDATLTMNYALGDVKLTSITATRTSRESQTQDFATAGFYYVLRNQNYTQWSQELRASGKIGSTFDYVVGGYYFNSHYNFAQYTTIGAGDALYSTTDPSATAPGEQIEYAATRSYAVFGDFNWAFADHFRLSFGGRWSHDQKILDNGYACTQTVDSVTSDTGAICPVGEGKADFSRFTPKVGLDWRPNADTMLYASWSRGYRAGGFSPRAATAYYAGTPFQPETVDAYEIGAKLATPNHVAELNIAGFVSDYKNMQQNLTVPGGPTGNQTITANVPGGALIKGIEADATVRPVARLRVTASASIMSSHFRNYVTCGVYSGGTTASNSCGAASTSLVPFNYSANDLIYAPDFSGSLNGEYTLPTSFGKVVANAGWRHIAPYDEQISIGSSTTTGTASGVTGVIVNGNDPRVRTATQDLVDASLTVDFSLQGHDAYVRVFGRNLANVHTTSAAFTVAGDWAFASAIEPRTWGGTIGVKF
jgi:iron complex outermembrane recepter protein